MQHCNHPSKWKRCSTHWLWQWWVWHGLWGGNRPCASKAVECVCRSYANRALEWWPPLHTPPFPPQPPSPFPCSISSKANQFALVTGYWASPHPVDTCTTWSHIYSYKQTVLWSLGRKSEKKTIKMSEMFQEIVILLVVQGIALLFVLQPILFCCSVSQYRPILESMFSWLLLS